MATFFQRKVILMNTFITYTKITQLANTVAYILRKFYTYTHHWTPSWSLCAGWTQRFVQPGVHSRDVWWWGWRRSLLPACPAPQWWLHCTDPGSPSLWSEPAETEIKSYTLCQSVTSVTPPTVTYLMLVGNFTVVWTYRIHKVRIKPIAKLLDARCDFIKCNSLLASIWNTSS